MGTTDTLDYLAAIDLTADEVAQSIVIVEQLYRLYTEFVAEMYACVSSHRIDELRALPFFRERVTGEVSRPLTASELSRHRSPLC